MKKLISGLLSLVMAVGLLATPAAAGNYSKLTYYDDELIYPVSEAPEMDYTRTIGPVTFSNVGAVTRRYSIDANGEPILIHYVTMAVGGCMRTEVEAEVYCLFDGNYNNVYGLMDVILERMQPKRTEPPVFGDDYNQIKTNHPALRVMNGGGFVWFRRSGEYIKAFAPTQTKEDCWPAGLVWQFGWHEENLKESHLYWDAHMIQVEAGGEMWYYMVNIEDDVSSFTGNRPDGSYANIIDVDAPATAAASVWGGKVYFYGYESSAPIYGINGEHYMSLRDLAVLTKEKNFCFDVDWNGELTAPIYIKTGENYTPVGNELTGKAKAQSATLISPAIYVDGVPTPMTVYNVGGEAYFRLMDMLHVLDIGYRYDLQWDSFKVTSGTYHNGKIDPGVDPNGYQALPSRTGIYVDGKKINFDAYTINGKDFVKIRDLAQSLQGTPRSFGVEWDDSIQMILGDQKFDGLFVMHYRQPYVSVGGELTPGDGQSKSATRMVAHAVHKEGRPLTELEGYLIGGEEYYDLRDLLRVMNIGVTVDQEENALLIDSSSDYDVVKLWESEKKTVTAPVPQPEPEVPDGQFSDVKQGDWFNAFVEKICGAGWMTGKGDGVFDPGGKLSLAEVMVLASRLHADQTGAEIPEAEGAWYMPYYTYCLENGILREGELSQEDMSRSATRFEMVDLLDRATQEDKTAGGRNEVEDGFIPDLSEEEPLGGVVYRWYRAGILTGDGEHRFNGPNSITRAEVSVILCQLLGLVDRAQL